MSNTAFICPLYDMKNHFDLAINLYRSKIEYEIQSDLIFIFSNEEQKDKFALRVKNELGVDDLLYNIMPEGLSEYKSKAVTKKIYGLKEYMNQYDYIILTDCEALFVRSFNVDEVAKEIWDSRNMFASNISLNGFTLRRICYKKMGLYYNKKLRKALGGFIYGFWFNELQVYKCSYLPGFFDWLKSFDQDIIFNTWECFEYYMFYAYMCLMHDVKIKKYHYFSVSGGINEDLYLFNKKTQEKIIKSMQFHWTTSREIKSDNIYMLFHLDRVQNYYVHLDAHGGKYFKYADGSNHIICTQIVMHLMKMRRVITYIKAFAKRCFILVKEFPEYMQETKKQ